MDDKLKELCDLFVKNKKVVSKTFSWDSSYMGMATAYILAASGVEANKEVLKETEAVLKSKSEVFSEYRSNAKTALVAKMLLSDSPAEYFDKVSGVYKLLNRKKIFGNEYKLIAAITICDHVTPDKYDEVIARTNEIYKKMSQKHMFLTSSEDIPLAALLASTDMDVDGLIEEMEKCYKMLKTFCKDSNGAQSLSHVLALNETNSVIKCEKVEEILKSLKTGRHKYGSGIELAIIGTLAMLDMPPGKIAELIIETEDYIKTQRGFGPMSVETSTRRLYAAELVLARYTNAENATDVLLVSALSMTVALEICLLVILSSSTIIATMN